METGVDYFHARYFTPALERFNSPDPMNAGADVTNPQSWNEYAYVGNNPLSNVDPTGKDGCNVFNVTYEGSGSGFPCDASQHFGGPAESPTSIAGPTGNATGSMIGYQSPELAEGEAAYLSNVRSVIGWVAGDDPVTAMAFAPVVDNQQYCESKNISAVNQAFGLNVTTTNVTGSFYRNGAWNFNFSINAPQSSAPVGRYPLSTFTAVTGIGANVHLPTNPGPNPPPNADPSVYGTSSNGNFTFTTHMDSAYSTWYTPIGAAIHGIVDVLLKTNHGC
jgi:RHS repeat-associated protein